ncbi:MAG: corrinoid protein [Calditrichae bacterium]|nr:corrinoid protein [Calditrichota bacterium]MCB9058712.1 corrinoid protein [Calditrichia bacterium]
MHDILEQLSICVERGKVDIKSPFPADMKGREGADELTRKAIENKIPASKILNDALMTGMQRIGEKFGQGKAFIPDLLIAAKAMNAAMEHLKPFFESGEAKHKGKIIMGTVSGDLHDIGKNIVKMVLKGSGWDVIDLGVDVSSQKFIDALAEHPGSYVGLSALLTTTMLHMQDTTQVIKDTYPGTKVFVGGAPLSQEFCDKIGADGYFRDPQSFAKYLSGIVQ